MLLSRLASSSRIFTSSLARSMVRYLIWKHRWLIRVSSLTKSSSSRPPALPLGPSMDPSNHSQPLSSVPSHSSTPLRRVMLTLLPLKKSTSEMSSRQVLASHQHVKLPSLQVSKPVRMRLQSTKYVLVA